MSATLPVKITLRMLHDTIAGFPLEIRKNKATDSFLLATSMRLRLRHRSCSYPSTKRSFLAAQIVPA
jgi:hypothetical protein